MPYSKRTVAERLMDALKKGRKKTFETIRGEHPEVTELGSLKGESVVIQDQTFADFRLTGMTFRNITFTGVRFTGATRLERVTFENCRFERCAFFGVAVQGMRLIRSESRRCTFEEMRFTRVDVSEHSFTQDLFLGCRFEQIYHAYAASWEHVSIDQRDQRRILGERRRKPRQH